MKRAILGVVIFATIIMSAFSGVSAFADAKESVLNGADVIVANSQDEKSHGSLSSTIVSIVNVLLFIVGLCCVVVIIVSGLNFITSNGDAAKLKKAKDALAGAIIGLVIAILAYAIIAFIVSRLR